MAGYVVRIALPDRPGALGLVASRIGAVGGDIVAINILERDEGHAVDEFVVEIGGQHLAAERDPRSGRGVRPRDQVG
jgi:UTP:GlnB (protein PII) uridylyltransferase